MKYEDISTTPATVSLSPGGYLDLERGTWGGVSSEGCSGWECVILGNYLRGYACNWSCASECGSCLNNQCCSYTMCCTNGCTLQECSEIREAILSENSCDVLHCGPSFPGAGYDEPGWHVDVICPCECPPPRYGSGPFKDCLCSIGDLNFCMTLVGAQPCCEGPCDVPPEEPRISVLIDSSCTMDEGKEIILSVKRICLHLGLTLPPGCEHECLSDYQFIQCLRDICAGKRTVRVRCGDWWWCGLFGSARTYAGWIWLCRSHFLRVHGGRYFDSYLFHELLHWCEPGWEWEPPWGGGPVERRQGRCYPGTT